MHGQTWGRVALAGAVMLAAGACSKKEQKGSAEAQRSERAAMPKGPAEYTVVLKSTWTPKTHPFQYPKGAHFSGLIGASHNASYSIFALGRRPTPGLERLSEEGKHSPLDTEIRTAIDQGNALALFESGGLQNFKDSMIATVRDAHTRPLVDVG